MKRNVVVGGAIAASLASLLVVACGGDDLGTFIIGDGGVQYIYVDAAPTAIDGTIATTDGSTSTGDDGSTNASCNGTVCGASCVNTDVDSTNCGGCGNACPSGQLCSEGHCGETCSTGYVTCTTDAGAGPTAYCANTGSDNANCGGCGSICGAGQTCTSGVCVTCSLQTIACPAHSGFAQAGFDASTGDAGTVIECIDPLTDTSNCGGCGIVCPGTEQCFQGVCRPSCSATTTACYPEPPIILDAGADAAAFDAGAGDGGAGYSCVDLTVDSNNCGGCNLRCAAGTSCAGGTCVAPSPVSAFGSSCKTLATNFSSPMDIDANGRIYAVVNCGVANSVSVATSTDGHTYGTPVVVTTGTGSNALGTLNAASLLAGPGGVVHLLISGSSGTYYSRSTDSGATWSTPVQIDTANHTGGFAQIAASGTHVVLAGSETANSSTPWVYFNAASGVGAFTAATTPPSGTGLSGSGGVGYAANGTLWFGSEGGDLYAFTSTDNGATFGARTTISNGTFLLSSWGWDPAGFAVSSTLEGYALDQYTATAAFNEFLYANGIAAAAVDPSGNGYFASTNAANVYVQRQLVATENVSNILLGTNGPPATVLARTNANANISNPNITIRGTGQARVLWTETAGGTTSIVAGSVAY